MSSDSQKNKQNLRGNVVPIKSVEDVNEIERKLAAARRLFSLHEYSLCEQVVNEVLADDPDSSKAKALLELVSIKLSKRKLYKKLVNPKLTPKSLEPSLPADPLIFDVGRKPSPREETAIRGADLRRPTRVRAQEETNPPSPRSNRHTPSVLPKKAEEKALTNPSSSMRERTIAAMVELLKDRNKGVEEWKDTQDGKQSHEGTRDVAEPQVFAPNINTNTIPTAPQAILEALREPRIDSGKIEMERNAPKEKVLQNPTEEKSSFQVNFLPGSLAELFETTGELREEQRADLDTTDRSDETAALQVHTNSEVSLEAFQKVENYHSPRADHRAAPSDENETRSEAVRDHGAITPPLNVQEPKALETAPSAQEPIPRIVHLPDVNVFDRITPAREAPPHEFIDRKLERHSEEMRNSELKAVSIAQIKKYLYQEQYDLCSLELERIRGLFPQSAEIQAFVENTSRRLVDLKAMKNFESQAKELMRSAVSFYQEGKFLEAIAAAQRVLQVNSHHTQAREFVEFVQRRINSEQKKEVQAQTERYCKSCGTSVDSSSQFCHHCGKRLP